MNYPNSWRGTYLQLGQDVKILGLLVESVAQRLVEVEAIPGVLVLVLLSIYLLFAIAKLEELVKGDARLVVSSAKLNGIRRRALVQPNGQLVKTLDRLL